MAGQIQSIVQKTQHGGTKVHFDTRKIKVSGSLIGLTTLLKNGRLIANGGRGQMKVGNPGVHLGIGFRKQ
jgi:hypothetical protein